MLDQDHKHEPLQDHFGAPLFIVMGNPEVITLQGQVCRHCHLFYIDEKLVDGIQRLPIASPEKAADEINKQLGGPYLEQLAVGNFDHGSGKVVFLVFCAQGTPDEELQEKIKKVVIQSYARFDIELMFVGQGEGLDGVAAEESETG